MRRSRGRSAAPRPPPALAVGGQRQHAALGCSSGRIRSMAWPCSDTVSTSCSAQPSRDAASEKADGAGITSISSAGTWRASVDADAVEKRIARGQHADLLAAQRHHVAHRRIERARPGARFALDQRPPPAPDAACRRTRSRPRRSAAWPRRPDPLTPSSPMPTTVSHFLEPSCAVAVPHLWAACPASGERMSGRMPHPLRVLTGRG